MLKRPPVGMVWKLGECHPRHLTMVQNYEIRHPRVGRDPISVSRIWNRWVQDGNTERRAGSQRPPINSSQEHRHVTRRALMDRAATSRVMSQELRSLARQVSARTVRQSLLQHGLSARRPCLQLPLTLHHRQERLHLCDQR
ncbi:HTH_Tnp_Tc3_2 domain-containing protein [Trichonephila clavipes]|nr:HTH_Tnp_Tc3_2 domain-containing protein [Trichonephila clavipes]